MLVFVMAAVTRGVTHRWWPALLLLLLGVLSGVCGVYGFETLRERFFDPESGFHWVEYTRLWMWQAAWQITLDHPWFGAGPSIFNSIYGRYRDPVDQCIPEYVHNDYLQALCDYGVIGFVLMGLLVGAFLVAAWRIHRRWHQRGVGEHAGWHWPYWLEAERAGRPAWLLGGAAAVVACILHSAVDFNLHMSANALTLTVIMAMGMLAGHARRLTEDLADGTKPLLPVIKSVELGVAARRVLATLIVLFVTAEATMAVPNGASCCLAMAGGETAGEDGVRRRSCRGGAGVEMGSRSHEVALLFGRPVIERGPACPKQRQCFGRTGSAMVSARRKTGPVGGRTGIAAGPGAGVFKAVGGGEGRSHPGALDGSQL